MADITRTIGDQEPPYRVLAMDGGGIFGVFTAIMLRKLCDAVPDFLREDRITLFAGTSAGAINALLLAKQDDPREAIERRTLEKFYKDERLYTNRLNPVTGMLSLIGLASWAGEADFYALLDEHFGDMKMKDLKHRVLITAFDLWGTRDAPSSTAQSWKPKVFYNFPDTEHDRDRYVKDVAYGAASPPTGRRVIDGITDGGFCADDPSVNAIAKIMSQMRESNPISAAEESLRDISVLSLGVGAATPHYFLRSFDFGILPFNLLPTHFGHGFLESPVTTFVLNPDKQATMYIARQLVGEDDYFRLDPPAIKFPVPSVATTSTLARFSPFREFYLAQICQGAESPGVGAYINQAEKWLRNHPHGWA